MRYEGLIYRPPSEANSLLIQVTVGCSHNKCTFCSMYKEKQFKIRDLKEVKEDIINFQHKENVNRVFLCDGDALVLPTKQLIEILDLINKYFKNCQRVSCYATFKDILNKSNEELKLLKEHGLDLVYLGAESGSDKVLENVKKGVSVNDMKEASIKLHDANIEMSVMIISGLGGQELFKEHAYDSAMLINMIKPKYFGLLSLMVQNNTPLYEDIESNKFSLISPIQALEELKIMLNNIDIEDCFFSSNHVSNYVYLKGNLSKDKMRLLEEIKYYEKNMNKMNLYNKSL